MQRSYAGRSFGRRSVLFLILALLVSLAGADPAASQIQPIELEGFIVTGTPVPRLVGTESAHVTVLDGEELRARGVARVADALAEVPGLVVVQNGSYGSVTSTFFRGAESDHVKVLLDGVEVNRAGGSFDFSGLLMAGVERIEVARGPASALYGSDASAGVINVITRRGRGAPKASVSVGGGSYGRRDWSGEVAGGGDRSSYSLTASRLATDGILDFNNAFRSTSFAGAFFLTPDDRTSIGLTGRYGDRVYHFPTDGSGNVVDTNAFTYGDELALALEAGRSLTERVHLAASIRTYGWDGGSDDRPDGPSDDTGFFAYSSLDAFQRTSVDLRSNVSFSESTVLTLGAELEEEEQQSFSESESDFGPSTSRSRNDRTSRGYYAHLTTNRGGWSGNAGVRVEDNEQYGEFFTYQAGLSWALPATGTRFRGNAGKGMKAPTFFETTSSAFSVGNPDLEPEVTNVWEVGVEQAVGASGGAVSLTWFDQELSDLIQYTFAPPAPGGPNYYNVAAARSRGLEMSATFPLGPFSLSGGYTYLDTEVLDAGFDEGEGAVFVEGEALIRRPTHQVGARGSYRFRRGSLTASLRFVDSRWDRDFSAWPAAPVELESYTLVGFGGEMEVLTPGDGRPGVHLRARVENLLDETYQEVFGFRAPGRAFLVGARVTFGG